MGHPLQERKEGRGKAESSAKYFEKWLREDVLYIISPEEREIFSKLSSDEEKERFIEQFWLRRDFDSTTAENEFRTEHYRRIQFANDWFRSGEAGWKTDRGRIYIVYDPPTEVTRYSGGQYERPFTEGGGVTTTYPFEKWVYRHIEGIGDNVELEFVDDTLAGEYHLAMSPHEKDALLNVPNAGLTIEEALGLAPKSDRVRNLYAANPQPTALNSPGFRDSIFERLHQFFALQRPPTIQFKDLKEAVTASVQYNLMPFRVRADWIYLGSDEAAVPVTLKIDNDQLTYQEALGIQRATVNVYGSLRNLQGQIVAEFEDTLTTEYTAETVAYRAFQNSVYQKQLVLKPGLYRLNFAVKDAGSGRLGSLQMRVQVPPLPRQDLFLSPIILSRKIEELRRGGQAPGLFEIGDLKIIPEVGDTFTPRDQLFFYLQAYNVQLDQFSGKPSLVISYSLRSDSATLMSRTDEAGQLIHYHSPQRVVCLGGIPLKTLAAGDYRLEIDVRDHLSGRDASTSATFHVVESLARASK